MAQTVIGLFDNATEAKSAVQALLSNGFNQSDVDLSARNSSDTTTTSTTDSYYTGSSQKSGEGITDSISNFFGSLFDDKTEASTYSEIARRSNAIVTVHANTSQLASTAASILDQHGAVDIDERSAQYRNTSGTANNITGAERTQGDVAIPIIEEQLQVGKREVETGGVRLRSRVIERPVEETLRLREEHVFVDRRPVDRAATDADFNTLRDGQIELTEHSEVAVVGKEARVVEEVSIGKEVTERTETIRDTVRKTDVEVEEINNSDKNRTTNS